MKIFYMSITNVIHAMLNPYGVLDSNVLVVKMLTYVRLALTIGLRSLTSKRAKLTVRMMNKRSKLLPESRTD
jgi:hypothetical protein